MSFCAPPKRFAKLLLFHNVRSLFFCVLLHVLSIITRKYLTQHDIKEKPGCSCLARYLQNIKCCRSQIYVLECFSARPHFPKWAKLGGFCGQAMLCNINKLQIHRTPPHCSGSQTLQTNPILNRISNTTKSHKFLHRCWLFCSLRQQRDRSSMKPVVSRVARMQPCYVQDIHSNPFVNPSIACVSGWPQQKWGAFD